MYRERFRRARELSAKVQRSQAAGLAPNDAETDRLVAEFYARGGRATECPPGSALDQKPDPTVRPQQPANDP